MKNKKIWTVFLLTVVVLLLSGCSLVSRYVEEKMVEKSGIRDDANYQMYEKFNIENKLDEDGFVIENAEDNREKKGSIHVTFGENNNLAVKYYLDADCRNEVDKTWCYLNPGSKIYAKTEVKDNVFSSMYSFADFRIIEIDDSGSRKDSSSVKASVHDDGFVISIPSDFKGTDVAIEPTGSYQNRVITLKDYYTDENDNSTELDGNWMINDKEFQSGSVEISPISSYIVSYNYDSNEYFYLSSSPESYYIDNDDGVVIFNQRKPEDETVNYEVVLHKYLTVNLVSDKDREVRVNGGNTEIIKSNCELSIPHLKYGDSVTIQTNKKWSALENNEELIQINEEVSEEKNKDIESIKPGVNSIVYTYTLIVPEKDGQFTFNPYEYKYEHGEITFKCFGNIVTTTQILAKGSKIYYELKSADDGYWLSGNNHYIVVGDEEETIDQLKSIHLTPKVDVIVSLPQPQYGGSVKYMVDGKRELRTKCYAHSGSVITVTDIKPWEGWIAMKSGEFSYQVSDTKSQEVNIDGMSIEKLFKEDEAHKPKLTVTLDKSVGESMMFKVKASGMETENTSYKKKNFAENLVDSSVDILKGQKIGTEEPIEIAISNSAIQHGKAVRMVIVKNYEKNNKKGKMEEIRYIDDLSVSIEPISIYTNEELPISPIWYTSIDVLIGVVDVDRITIPNPATNTIVSVQNKDTKEFLMNGDYIDGSQIVTVTIKPKSGYYITGQKVTNDIYQDSMKYSDYLESINSIVKEHQAVPYYYVTLDHSDPWAEYTYKLDGVEVKGNVKVKEGQKLELTYTITDSKYTLSKAYGGFLGAGSSNTSATVSIKIDSSMDKQTITKSNFNLETVKVG